MSKPFSLPNDKPLRDDDAPVRGFRMIDNIQIKNFRCFESVQLTDCRRVNLIVGRNAGGKTALLEALYLAAGSSPALVLEIKQGRGEGQIRSFFMPQRVFYEGLWKDFFHNLDQDREISIEFTGSHGFQRSLQIQYKQASKLVMAYKDEPIGLQTERWAVVFTWKDENGEYELVPQLAPQGLAISGDKLPPDMGSSFFATQVPLNSRLYAEYYSSLSKQKKHAKVLELLQTEFPFVEEISVETGIGGEPTLYVGVRDLPEKIPVAALSSGVNKLLCILLGIALKPKGIVLVDEIENGFYFDRLGSIWALILRFAQEYRVQVFASTHSRECLEAAASVAEAQPEEFSLIRTVKVDGSAEIRQFDGKRFVGALSENFEIR